MKKKFVTTIVTFGVGLMLFLTLASSSFAYKVGSVVIDMTIPRGKAGSDVLSLRGNVFGEEVLLYLVDIVLDRRGGYHFERLEDWKYSGLGWLKLYKATSVKRVGEKIRIVGRLYKEKELLVLKTTRDTYVGIRIKTPFNIKPGQYYAGVMVEPVKLKISRGVLEEQPAGIEEMTRLAIPITINIPGVAPKFKGKIIETGADITKEEIRILATFENAGNVLEYVKGRAQIINKEDGKVYDVVTMKALNPQAKDGTGKIFPESLRDFEGMVKRPLPAGEYAMRITLEIRAASNEPKARKRVWKRDSFTVTEAVAAEQKELLTLNVDTELLQYELKPGGFVTGGIKVVNQDFQDLKVDILIPEGTKWLRVAKKVNLRRSQPGRLISKTLRYTIRIPRKEKVDRELKIVFKPERGKPVVVDVVITEKK